MTAMKILVADELAAEGLEVLKREQIAYDVKVGLKEDELASAVGGYDALIVRSGAKVTAKVLDKPGNLKAIARAGVGVDNIDLEAATAKGILVLNTAEASTLSTAEHAREVGAAQVEEEQLPGHAARRQDAGGGRLGAHRADRRDARPGDGDERPGIRPVLHRPHRNGRPREADSRFRRVPLAA
jgi:hypothetical protein